MTSQYIAFQRGYLDEDPANRIVRSAPDFLPYWIELGIDLGDSDFHQAVREEFAR